MNTSVATFANLPLRARLGAWVLVISLAGYPLAGLFGALLNLDSKVVSIPFRTLTLGLSLWVIVMSIGRTRWWIAQRWLVLFFAMYMVRLVWDFAFAGLDGAVETFGLFLIFCGLPMLAAGMGTLGRLPEAATAWRLGLLGASSCLLAVAMQTFGLGAAQTIDPFFTGGRLMFESVNAITLGHTATTTLVCVLCLLRTRPSVRQKILLGTMGLFAGLCLVATGSRGPVVALAACGLAYALVSRHRWWVVVMVLLLVPPILSPDTELTQRFGTIAGEDTSSLERLILQTNALQQFLDHPVLGSAYVELVSGSYPHNLVVETAMALGVPGLLVLLLVLGGAAVGARRQIRHGRLLVALLFIQYLVSAQVSGAVWGLQLWIVVALICKEHRRASPKGAQRRVRPELVNAN